MKVYVVETWRDTIDFVGISLNKQKALELREDYVASGLIKKPDFLYTGDKSLIPAWLMEDDTLVFVSEYELDELLCYPI